MKKSLVLLFSVLVISLSHSITTNAANYDDFTFEIKENELALTGYNGSSPDIVVPEEVNGYAVTAIDDKAFYGNKIIRNVSLPNTVNYLGAEVFSNSSIVSINIPDGVQFIPDNTFSDCKNLEKVDFHDNIIAISGTAFKNTSIGIPENLKESVAQVNVDGYGCGWIQHRDFIYDVYKNSCSVYKYTGNDTEIVLPNELKGIPVSHYGSFLAENSVVTSINTDIASIVFPENATEITYNFLYLPNIKNITFLGKNVTFTNLTNFNNLPIENITLPAGTIRSSFSGNKTLKSVNFTGDNELYIADNIFSDCKALEQVTFDKSYKNIYIGSKSFYNTAIENLEISCPSEISSSSFRECTNLKTVRFNNAKVANSAFLGCTSLVNAEFSGNTTLERNSFLECTSLVNIDTENTQKLVGNAFDGCISLKTVNGKTPTEDFIKSNFYMADDIGFLNDYAEKEYKKIVAENINDDMSDIEKVRILHDWVCKHTKYADNDKLPEYHTDASILLNDSTVCEGYSKACNLLFNYAGIETYYIHSFSHAWNIVNIGGQYFHIDSTWDDGDEISYDWFMKSDSEMKESHGEWEAYIPTSMHSFQQKCTPECKYAVGDTNTDGEVNIADAVKMTKYLLGAESIPKEKFILFDINFDNRVDVFDMIIMKKKALSN